MLGFSYYEAPLALQADAYMGLCHEIGRGALPLQLTRMPLSHIDEAWDRMKQGGTSRLVLTPERVLV